MAGKLALNQAAAMVVVLVALKAAKLVAEMVVPMVEMLDILSAAQKVAMSGNELADELVMRLEYE